jgi:sugar O-acyltransferase (sialic acid O-acetyltransferase NeuD family)
MENPVLIFGAGSLGRVALDIFTRNNVVVYGFLDENKELHGTEIASVPVLGSPDDEGFTKLIGKKCEAFVAADDSATREDLVDLLTETRKTMPVNAVHDTATVSASASLGHGNLIGAGVVVNPDAQIGNHCLIHARAVIDTQATLGDYVQVGAGAVVGPGAKLSEHAFIGAGTVLVAGVTVGKGARVGAGSVVVENVPAHGTVFGNPAKKV